MSRRNLQPGCNLYLVLDTQVADYDTLLKKALRAVAAGVDIIQLRDKTGSRSDILSFSRDLLQALPEPIPFILNDRVDLVEPSGASGVHIGQDDMPLPEARRILGPGAIIGVSCQRWEHVFGAQLNGANYIGFGSVYRTQTKPDRAPMDFGLLRIVARESRIPVFAIGGIGLRNVKPLITLGATRVAVTRAILEAQDLEETVTAFKDMLAVAELVAVT